MRHIIFAVALLTLTTSCWKTEDTPTCSLTLVSAPDYRWSTSPHKMGVTIDQQKLTTLMSTPTNEVECYLSQQNMALHKIAGQEVPNPLFSYLKSAEEGPSQNWQNFKKEFKNDLMGLTSTHFSGGEPEQIQQISIVLRDDAQVWHLWHEYSHALLAQFRASHPQHNLYIPSERFLKKKFKELRDSTPNDNDYSLKLQKLLQGYKDHIDKTYSDEILIEATLTELATQHAQLLNLSHQDWFQTMHASDFFMERYESYLQKTLTALGELEELNLEHPENLMAIHQTKRYLLEQKTNLIEIATESSAQIKFE